MTANQIIIPLALTGIVALALYLRWHNRRLAKANQRQEHGPNAPASSNDKAAIAHSIMSGAMGRDR